VTLGTWPIVFALKIIRSFLRFRAQPLAPTPEPAQLAKNNSFQPIVQASPSPTVRNNPPNQRDNGRPPDVHSPNARQSCCFCCSAVAARRSSRIANVKPGFSGRRLRLNNCFRPIRAEPCISGVAHTNAFLRVYDRFFFCRMWGVLYFVPFFPFRQTAVTGIRNLPLHNFSGLLRFFSFFLRSPSLTGLRPRPRSPILIYHFSRVYRASGDFCPTASNSPRILPTRSANFSKKKRGLFPLPLLH